MLHELAFRWTFRMPPAGRKAIDARLQNAVGSAGAKDVDTARTRRALDWLLLEYAPRTFALAGLTGLPVLPAVRSGGLDEALQAVHASRLRISAANRAASEGRQWTGKELAAWVDARMRRPTRDPARRLATVEDAVSSAALALAAGDASEAFRGEVEREEETRPLVPGRTEAQQLGQLLANLSMAASDAIELAELHKKEKDVAGVARELETSALALFDELAAMRG